MESGCAGGEEAGSGECICDRGVALEDEGPMVMNSRPHCKPAMTMMPYSSWIKMLLISFAVVPGALDAARCASLRDGSAEGTRLAADCEE